MALQQTLFLMWRPLCLRLFSTSNDYTFLSNEERGKEKRSKSDATMIYIPLGAWKTKLSFDDANKFYPWDILNLWFFGQNVICRCVISFELFEENIFLPLKGCVKHKNTVMVNYLIMVNTKLRGIKCPEINLFAM